MCCAIEISATIHRLVLRTHPNKNAAKLGPYVKRSHYLFACLDPDGALGVPLSNQLPPPNKRNERPRSPKNPCEAAEVRGC